MRLYERVKEAPLHSQRAAYPTESSESSAAEKASHTSGTHSTDAALNKAFNNLEGIAQRRARRHCSRFVQFLYAVPYARLWKAHFKCLSVSCHASADSTPAHTFTNACHSYRME